MSILPKPTLAAEPRTKTAKTIALIYAVILVIFAVAQLFTFDDFLELVITFNLPVSALLVGAIAPVLVASEVFALPFLLRMPLSTAFRRFSMGLGWLVATLWLFITLWLVTSDPTVTSVGFLGTVGHLSQGLWAVGVSLLLGVLTIWASWGLWPGARAKK